MINLNTPSDVLWATLSKEYEKAKYWMIKQYGGEKRYEAMRDDLLRRCAFSQCTINSKPVYYTSQEGNRWICFENATYYPDSYASNAMPSCFCYYETASSIGLFMVGFSNSCSNEGMNCVLIFTPRMGVRKFAWREFAKLLMMEIYKFDEPQAAAYIKEIYPM